MDRDHLRSRELHNLFYFDSHLRVITVNHTLSAYGLVFPKGAFEKGDESTSMNTIALKRNKINSLGLVFIGSVQIH